MKSAVSSGAVVFIQEEAVYTDLQIRDVMLGKRCAAVEGLLIAWWRDEFGWNIVLSIQER